MQTLERDTFGICLAFCRLDLAKARKEDIQPCSLLREGIGKMSNYLVDCRFRTSEAKIAASRVALLCHLLRTDQCHGKLQAWRFEASKGENLRDGQIAPPQAALNKLLSISPESYYYWSEIFKPSKA